MPRNNFRDLPGKPLQLKGGEIEVPGNYLYEQLEEAGHTDVRLQAHRLLPESFNQAIPFFLLLFPD